jgi:uncharacterized protein
MISVNKDLKTYIETHILPTYSKNDGGHGIEHIQYVIERCFRFLSQFENADINIIYTIAAFHDIAHHIDKRHHETLSAKVFWENNDMKKFFSEEERLLIKEAIEDHRASSKNEPRSIYGRIISSADRSTDIDEFLRRTHKYTLKHFPNCTVSEMIDRAYVHTKEKYGRNGYAKHYVKDAEYDEFRETIKILLSDKRSFEKKYKAINML